MHAAAASGSLVLTNKRERSAVRAAGRQAQKQPRFDSDINLVDSTTIKFGAAGFYQSPTLTASSTRAIYGGVSDKISGAAT